MKLKLFLLEQSNVSYFEPIPETWEKIKKECKKYLNDIGYNLNYILARKETTVYGSSKVYRNKVRKNRKPTDTPIEIQQKVDKLLKRKGLPTRADSLFVRGATSLFEMNISGFFVICPVGNYKFAYNPVIEDFYLDVYERIEGYQINSKIVDTFLNNYVKGMKTDSIKKAWELMLKF